MPESKYRDGFEGMLGGMNEGIDSSLIAINQYVRGVNTTVRSGTIATRPKWVEESDLSGVPAGKFQGGDLFRLNDADRLTFSVDGKVYSYNTDTTALVDYSAFGTLDATVAQVHFLKAEKVFIVQDGVNPALFINYNDNPTEARVSTTTAGAEVPIGTIMAYVHGRVFVLLSQLPEGTPVGARFIAAGDIFQPNDQLSHLKFTEIDYLAGGGAFSLPNELGFVTGMNYLRNARTGSGAGSLIVFAQDGASAFSMNAERRLWQQIDVSQVLFSGRGVGTRSPWSIIPANNDLFYRGVDGHRTIGFSIGSMSGSDATLSTNPVSTDILKLMKLDDKDDMLFVSSAFTDNRILSLVNRGTEGSQFYFNGVISLDASPVASFGTAYRPVYDGVWTGLKILRIVNGLKNGREVTFAFVLKDGRIKLYRLDDGESTVYDGTSSRPVCRLYTRAMHMEAPDVEKRIKQFDIWLKDVRGPVDIKFYYRPKGYPLWNQSNTATINASATTLPQLWRKIRLSVNSAPCDVNATKESLTTSESFELCVEWTGQASVFRGIVHANEDTTSPKIGCKISGDELTIAAGEAGVELDDFDYEVAQ